MGTRMRVFIRGFFYLLAIQRAILFFFGTVLLVPSLSVVQEETSDASLDTESANREIPIAQPGAGTDASVVTIPTADEAAEEQNRDTVAGDSVDQSAREDAPIAIQNKQRSAPDYQAVAVIRAPISQDRTGESTTIDGQRLRDSARGSTLEALSQESADVYVSGRGALHGVANGASGAIHIRGLGGSPNSQVLVVEDGVPDYQGIFGHPIPDAYVPFLVDEIVVIKGGDSVLYGTNAMAGAVVIRNRWREQPGYEILNDAAVGSYATLRESASMLGRFGPWDTVVGVTALSTDGHRQGAGGNALIGHTVARYRFTRDMSLALRNKAVKIDGADPGTVTHPYTDHFFDVFRDNASLQLVYQQAATRLTMTPYLNTGIHQLYDGFHSIDIVGGTSTDLHLKIHPTTELLLGINAERASGDIENRITEERRNPEVLADISFYNQLTLKPIAPLTVVLGTRELYSNQYEWVFLYKAGARVTIVDGLFLRTRIARNFRQPTIRELYLPYPTANPDLKPEYSLVWDFGAGWISEYFEVSCSGYRTAADDLIKYFGVWPSAEVVNIDRVVIWGVEGEIVLRMSELVSLRLTADFQDVGRYTRQNPDAKMNGTLDLGQKFGPHFVGGCLSGEWVHGLYMADYERQPMDDVLVFDLSLRYRYKEPDSKLMLEPYLFLRNMFDHQYAYIAGYTMPGFNLLLGLKVGV